MLFINCISAFPLPGFPYNWPGKYSYKPFSQFCKPVRADLPLSGLKLLLKFFTLPPNASFFIPYKFPPFLFQVPGFLFAP
jgi:hypothetical protein